jgi:hypothetical protein
MSSIFNREFIQEKKSLNFRESVDRLARGQATDSGPDTINDSNPSRPKRA